MRDLDQHLGDGLGAWTRARETSTRTGLCRKAVGEALDLGRHGGREEQGLAREGQQLADALDVGDEAHVEHAVGLVDHQHLDAGEQQLAALEMVEQAARRGDQHVDAAVDLAGPASLEGHAADEQRHRELVHACRSVSKFSATWAASSRVGSRIERARHAGAGAALFEQRQHRQHEGGGLAGAGLGDAQHVAALEGGGDGLRLDGRGGRVTRRR